MGIYPSPSVAHIFVYRQFGSRLVFPACHLRAIPKRDCLLPLPPPMLPTPYPALRASSSFRPCRPCLQKFPEPLLASRLPQLGSLGALRPHPAGWNRPPWCGQWRARSNPWLVVCCWQYFFLKKAAMDPRQVTLVVDTPLVQPSSTAFPASSSQPVGGTPWVNMRAASMSSTESSPQNTANILRHQSGVAGRWPNPHSEALQNSLIVLLPPSSSTIGAATRYFIACV